MNRRDFVAGFGKAAGIAGGAATAVAVAAYPKARDAASTLQREFKKLDRRIDQMDARHRRLIKALVVMASVSTGLDVLTLLRGDFI